MPHNISPPPVGATVRYVEPGTKRMRIGQVERVITRGERKGMIVVRPCSSTDHAASTVDPARVRVIS